MSEFQDEPEWGEVEKMRPIKFRAYAGWDKKERQSEMKVKITREQLAKALGTIWQDIAYKPIGTSKYKEEL